MLTVVPDGFDGRDERAVASTAGSSSLIDEIVREDARRMLAEVVQAEVDACIARFAAERDARGCPRR